MGKNKPAPAKAGTDPLNDLVRQIDEDRWLATRFAPREARARLISLYALIYEIARTAEVVSEPALGAIRLQWWREAIDEVFEGQTPRPHPAIQGLAEMAALLRPESAQLTAMIDARASDFEIQPFAGWTELEAYVDSTAGSVMVLAALIAAPDHGLTPQYRDLMRQAGRVWGYAGLVRALPFWTQKRRTFFPEKLTSHVGLSQADLFSGRTSHGVSAAARAVLDRASHAQREVRRLVHNAPKDLFAAYGYVALVPLYLQAMDRAKAPPGQLARRAKLVFASATGQI